MKRVRLRKGRGRYVPVPLFDGILLLVRPASYDEIQLVAAAIAPSIAALIAGSDAAINLVPLLGEDFDITEFSPAKAAAAGEKLALIDLVMLCHSDLEGGQFVGDDDSPLPWPDKGTVALLVADTAIARRLRAVIEGPLHEEIAEGNGLPGSPNGAPGTPDTAPDAAKPGPAAHSVGAA